MVVPVKLPGIQVYVLAPLAERLVVAPVQMVAVDAEAVTTGNGFTLIVSVRVFVQLPFAPVTVYVVIIVGVTTTVAPLNEPGFHV